MLLLAGASNVSAQPDDDIEYKTEKRIFLWDVTVSMVGATANEPGCVPATPRTKVPKYDYYKSDRESKWNYHPSLDIFDVTRDKLLTLIDDINDEQTEILVIPYTEELQTPLWVPSATKENKESIKKMVMSWDNLRPGATYTGACLNGVIKNYFNPNKINQVVLLTDGKPSTSDDQQLLFRILGEWDCNKVKSEYENNRLVYVMLTQAADIAFPSLVPDGGVQKLSYGESITEFLSFKIANPNQKIYLNELASERKLNSRVDFLVNCKAYNGRFNDADLILSVDCAPNPYVSVVDKKVKVEDDGTFIVTLSLAGQDRQFYSDAFADQGGVGTVELTCEVASSKRNATMEGSDIIEVNLVAKPEPRVTLSLSTK